MDLNTYKLLIQYEGSRYHGWQIQPNVKTIQGKLSSAIQETLDIKKFELYGAGRTDKGVHALGQAAHLKMPVKISPHILRLKLNDALPHDIVIKRVDSVGSSFHARNSAVARSYIYQISRVPSAFGKSLLWWIKDELSVPKMQEAISYIEGLHDFEALSERSVSNEATKVNVFSAHIEEFNDFIVTRIVATHFLWKMVRRIMNVTVEIGRGNLKPLDMKHILDEKKRLQTTVTAPPSGLFLEKIYYEKQQNYREPIIPVINF